MKVRLTAPDHIHRYSVAAFTLAAFFLICCCFAACYWAEALRELPEE